MKPCYISGCLLSTLPTMWTLQAIKHIKKQPRYRGISKQRRTMFIPRTTEVHCHVLRFAEHPAYLSTWFSWPKNRTHFLIKTWNLTSEKLWDPFSQLKSPRSQTLLDPLSVGKMGYKSELRLQLAQYDLKCWLCQTKIKAARNRIPPPRPKSLKIPTIS